MSNAAPEVKRPDWQAPATVHGFCTTRDGGESAAGYSSFNLAAHVEDDPGAVRRNRELLRRNFNLPEVPRWLAQVHSPVVVCADDIDGVIEADASWTDSPNVVCAVLTADCLPVLFTDRNGSCVAAAHAGWRGLCSGVLDLTVDCFFGADVAPDNILVWLGPAIGPAAYEVDAPVRDAFLGREPDCEQAFIAGRPDHWHFDLYAAARAILASHGVQNVSGGDSCTFTDARFFSHRRQAKSGRQATLIWRSE